MNHRMVSQQLFVESKNNRRIGSEQGVERHIMANVTNEVINEKGGVWEDDHRDLGSRACAAWATRVARRSRPASQFDGPNWHRNAA
jgi:glycine betaine/choline ABC-type transport system substrate-binding protein